MKPLFPQIDFKNVSFLLVKGGIQVLNTGKMSLADLEKLLRWVKIQREKK